LARPKHRVRPGATYFVTTETWQRQGLFRNAPIAAIVEAAIFRHRDKGSFFVHRYVVMPDHLHVILTPGDSTSLEKSIQLIKGGSSHEIGKRPGPGFPVWQAGFTEHQIRDRRDFDSHVKYIDENPVKADLAHTPNEYEWGSAASKFTLDEWPLASGAKAPSGFDAGTAGLKPRPSIAVGEISGFRASQGQVAPHLPGRSSGFKPCPRNPGIKEVL
jgi:REP-associated tyrosine transposase